MMLLGMGSFLLSLCLRIIHTETSHMSQGFSQGLVSVGFFTFPITTPKKLLQETRTLKPVISVWK